MKTIALSMILALAVIVCEEQTLFAPHYTTYGGTSLVASKTSSQNSLVPIVGVNRSVPLAGSGNGVISAATEFVKNDIWIVDTGVGLTSVESLGQVSRNSSDGLNGKGASYNINDEFDDFSGQEGMVRYEDIEDSHQFLPWHRW